MKKGAEYLIQQDAVRWFRLQYPNYVIFSVPNEATYKNKLYFNGLGTLTGVSDTVVLLPNKVLFVEFKAGKNSQSLEQKLFQQQVESLGLTYYLVYTVDDFIRIIRNELR